MYLIITSKERSNVCEGWDEEGEKERKRKRMEGETKRERTLNCSVRV